MVPRSTIAGIAVMLVAALGVTMPARQDAPRVESKTAALTAARIDRLLSEAYPAGEPGAAVFVSLRGTTILERGYGLADTERRTPVSPDTVFRLASVTKAFTGTAILMLAGRGALSLDDPVTKFLPSYPALGRAITVGHLLSHTSGLADYLDRPDSMAWAAHDYSVSALIDAFKDRPAAFAPGEKTAYSNSNYILLGAMIERVSGVSFAAFVDAALFKPLGMTGSSCGGSWSEVSRLAMPYEPARTATDQLDWSRLLVARPYTMSALHAAGGCVSSARDLARFHRALSAGTVIGTPVLTMSYAPARLADGSSDRMSAGGWQLDQVAGRRAAMRGGALPGVCTWFLTVPDEDLAVILLSNRTPGKPRCGSLAAQAAGIALER